MGGGDSDVDSLFGDKDSDSDHLLLTPKNDAATAGDSARFSLTPQGRRPLSPGSSAGASPSNKPSDSAAAADASHVRHVSPRSKAATAALQGGPRNASRYKKVKCVGKGAYGAVYKALDLESKVEVACKVCFHSEDPCVGGFPVSLLREISIMRSLSHENIVRLVEVVATPVGDPVIVMELCHSSLEDLLKNQTLKMSMSENKYVMRQILDAVAHIHARGILHRDIATKNILFNMSGEIKVCDFGIARRAFALDEELGFLPATGLENPNQVVTLFYRAIELLFGKENYGPALDVWSVGCIVGEMWLSAKGKNRKIFALGGSPGTPLQNQQMMVEKIFQVLGRPTNETWPGWQSLPEVKKYRLQGLCMKKQHRQRGDEKVFVRRFLSEASIEHTATEGLIDLLAGLLTLNPDDRLSAETAKNHPFFAQQPEPEWHDSWWTVERFEAGNTAKRGKDNVDVREVFEKQQREEQQRKKRRLEESEKKREEQRRKDLEARKKMNELRAQGKAPPPTSGKAASSAASKPKLPAGWDAQWSKSKRRYYFVNLKTKKAQFEMPTKPA